MKKYEDMNLEEFEKWLKDEYTSRESLTRGVELSYEAPSGCWGIKGSWLRGHSLTDLRSEYRLTAYIKFMNNLLKTPNFFRFLN